MTPPARQEVKQLHRLRQLRVDRARKAVAAAQQVVEAAADVVQACQRRVDGLRGELDGLEKALVGHLAPRLPRWSATVVAQREALADRIERAEYDLIADEQALEEAQEKLQQARAEWTRALAREDAVRGLVDDTQRALLLAREQKVERELEDQGAPRRRA